MSPSAMDPQTPCFALIREIREEAKNLQNVVRNVIKEYEATTPNPDALELVKKRAKRAWEDNEADVQKRLHELRRYLAEYPAVRDYWGDAETRLHNLWDRAHGGWIGGARDQAAFREVDAALDEMILEAAYVTIPSRLNQNLDDIRIGGTLNYDNEFKDELPDEADRDEVLNWIFDHAASVKGLIDKGRRVIYKAHSNWWVRGATYLAIVVVAALGFVIPFLRGPLNLDNVLVSRIADDGELARAYSLALLGLLLHVLSAGLKEIKAASTQGEQAPTLGNWLLWLHVRYLQACASVALVAIVAFFVAQTTGKIDAITMIAVGYSVDSLADLVLPKLPSLVTSRTEVIKKALA